MPLNLHAAWIGFLLGSLAGAGMGLFFHRDDWLGGYSSWERRMLRLGHIAWFGTGFLNLAFALTVSWLRLESGLLWPSRLFVLAGATMPAVCYLSAFRRGFRHLFPIPALALSLGVALTLWRILRP